MKWNPAVALKANGTLQGVTLKNLGNASLDIDQEEFETNNWCLHPDVADREIVESDLKDVVSAFRDMYDEDWCARIKRMHERAYRKVDNATGSGSWPPGKRCHPTLYPHDGYHATVVYQETEDFLKHPDHRRAVTDEEWQRTVVDSKVWPDKENPVTTIEEAKAAFSYDSQDIRVLAFERPQWREISGKRAGEPFNMHDMSTWLTYESLRRAGCFFIQVFTGSNGEHNIHEKMIPIPGSTAGYAYFPDGTCNDHVTSNIDNTISFSLVRSADLRTHEHGHNLRLYHEFNEPQSRHRSIMSYASTDINFQGFRESGEPYEYVEDHSWPELRKFFGGEYALPIDVEPPVPPVEPYTGEILLVGGGGFQETFDASLLAQNGKVIEGRVSGNSIIKLNGNDHFLRIDPVL